MKFESNKFNRLLAKSLQQLMQERQSFLLLGPRQTGKSTLIEHLIADLPPARRLQYFFQLPSVRERVEADPESIVREVEAVASAKPLYLIIDEIQKIPTVMDPLQFLLDRKKIVLLATGSSARKMRALGTNWLPGRIQLHHLCPLVWEETGFRRAQFDTLLRFGGLPGILAQSDEVRRAENLAAYTHLYLEEEIRAEAAVRNIPRFTKFLRLAALESGSAPNFSKIGSQVELSHTTVREYFQILEDSLIIHRLPAFGHSREATVRTAKYYFFDLGVRNAAAHIGHSEGIVTLQRGLLFEHFIILSLIAYCQGRAEISYWRTKQGDEVDVILESGKQRVGIEIKATTRPQPEDGQGLAAFRKKHKLDAAYLVCQIDRAQKFGSFLAMPWADLAERIAAHV